MSEVNPPLVLEGGSHDSDLLRQLWGDTYTAGVTEPIPSPTTGPLAVTEQDTPALGVTVAAGRAFVEGDEASDQGVYYVSNDAAHDVALATADATNDRIDLIVARVLDSFYSGASDEWELQAVTGTPAASPSAPAAPSNSLILAEVTVPADAGGNPAITNSDIEDSRAVAALADPIRLQGPLGVLGYAQRTTDQTGLGGTVTSIAGLQVTVPILAGRRTKVTVVNFAMISTSASDRGVGFIRMDDSVVQQKSHGFRSTSFEDGFHIEWIGVDLAADDYTFTARYQRTAGSGSHTWSAGSTSPSFILVEDVGPA